MIMPRKGCSMQRKCQRSTSPNGTKSLGILRFATIATNLGSVVALTIEMFLYCLPYKISREEYRLLIWASKISCISTGTACFFAIMSVSCLWWMKRRSGLHMHLVIYEWWCTASILLTIAATVIAFTRVLVFDVKTMQ